MVLIIIIGILNLLYGIIKRDNRIYKLPRIRRQASDFGDSLVSGSEGKRALDSVHWRVTCNFGLII